VQLTCKGIPFHFGKAQVVAQEDLKKALLESPALRPINYSSNSPIILAIDTLPIAVGFYLCQADLNNPCKQYFARFRSIALNDRECQFSQPKLELYRLFHTLHAYKIFIVGICNLMVEVDTCYIKGMLNNPDTVPLASINCWIVSILTFHFKLRHIPGKQHGPDGLSRRPPQPGDINTDEDPSGFDDWVDNLYGFIHLINHTAHAPHSANLLYSFAAEVSAHHPEDMQEEASGEQAADLNYNIIPRTMNTVQADKKLELAHDWLTFFKQLDDLSDHDYEALIWYASGFFIDNGTLWRCDTQGTHKQVLYKNKCIEVVHCYVPEPFYSFFFILPHA